MNYNLLTEPWIPVLRHNGTFDRLGIKDTLAQAHLVREIASSNPMDRVAIFRLLLAILYWCKGSPDPQHQGPSAAALPPDWFSPLDETSDCFNLLGDGARFYQYRTSGDLLPATYLAQQVPTGTNIAHFRHSRDERDGLCRACCAMGLARLPGFATQGGRGKSPGINQAPPVYVLPECGSLAGMLRSSWIPVGTLGTPAWQQPDIALPRGGHVPLLTGLTWLPRRVWLGDPEEPEASCISCGRTERLIRRCTFAGLGSMKTDESSPSIAWEDPQAIYTESAQSRRAPLRPPDAMDGFPRALAGWAPIVGELLAQKETTKSRWRIVGFSTKQDKYREATELRFSLLHRCGRPEEHREHAQRWLDEGRRVETHMLPQGRPGGARNRDWTHYRAAYASVRPQIECGAFASLSDVSVFGEQWWDRASSGYEPMMRAIAKSLSPMPTVSALRERMRIESIRPNPPQRQAPVEETDSDEAD